MQSIRLAKERTLKRSGRKRNDTTAYILLAAHQVQAYHKRYNGRCFDIAASQRNCGGADIGTRSLLVMAVSVGTAVLCEYICRRAMKRENSISDLSAAVTGLLLALTLPAQIPLYVVILGAAFSVVVAKQFFRRYRLQYCKPRSCRARIYAYKLCGAVCLLSADGAGCGDGSDAACAGIYRRA